MVRETLLSDTHNLYPYREAMPALCPDYDEDELRRFALEPGNPRPF